MRKHKIDANSFGAIKKNAPSGAFSFDLLIYEAG